MVPEAKERSQICRPRAAQERRSSGPILILIAVALDKSQGNQGIGQDTDPRTGYPGELCQFV